MTSFLVYLSALSGALRIVAILVAILLSVLGIGGLLAGRAPVEMKLSRRKYLIRKAQTCLVVAFWAIAAVVLIPSEGTMREMAGLPISTQGAQE